DVTQPPFIVDPVLGLAVVTDPNLGTLTAIFPITPAVADDAGYTAGVGLDPNGFVTDAKGSATLTLRLNYDITQSESAPIALPTLTESVQVEPVSGEGTCMASSGSSFGSFIDSGYARMYDTSSATPSFQLRDGSYRAKLIRGKVADLIIVEHLDGLTHG